MSIPVAFSLSALSWCSLSVEMNDSHQVHLAEAGHPVRKLLLISPTSKERRQHFIACSLCDAVRLSWVQTLTSMVTLLSMCSPRKCWSPLPTWFIDQVRVDSLREVSFEYMWSMTITISTWTPSFNGMQANQRYDSMIEE